ncbi:hypothetical protein BDY24DRAFT_413025 [Mrakia frigida]|uniref:uncharacterized protein n=1 Tax=Mrakia frigida TaxID=29902 RepID=UPI003FCC2708
MASPPPNDRKPLLPTHVNSTHRLSSPRISFPSSSSSNPADASSSGDQHLAPWTDSRTDLENRPGIPKLTRECFWSEFKCYGKWVLLIGTINGILIGVGLWVYFSQLHRQRP